MRVSGTIVAAIVLILIAQTHLNAQSKPAPGKKAPPPNSPAGKSARVDALFAKYAEGASPGAVVLVAAKGKILHKKGYGLANLETKTPIDGQTNFRLCSCSKPFTGMGIMALAEEGKLRFDDPLSKHFQDLPAWGAQVRVHHLLQHTSGMPDYIGLLSQDSRLSGEWPKSSKHPPNPFEPTSRDAYDVLKTQTDLRFMPGEKYEYSNSGYMLLGRLIAQASGKTYAEYLTDKVLKPGGMKDAVIVDEHKAKVPKVAVSYERDGGAFRDIDYTPMNYIVGDDGVFTNVEDLFRWMEAVFAGKIVSRKSLNLAFRPATLNDGAESYYGFGWMMGHWDGQPYVSHGGAWVGFRTSIARYPNLSLSVIVLSNLAEVAADDVAGDVARIYFP